MRKNKNVLKLLLAYILYLFRALLSGLIDIMFKHYDRNKYIINKLEKLEDVVYSVEWHLTYKYLK